MLKETTITQIRAIMKDRTIEQKVESAREIGLSEAFIAEYYGKEYVYLETARS